MRHSTPCVVARDLNKIGMHAHSAHAVTNGPWSTGSGCPDHSPVDFKGPNTENWRQKISTNRGRDRRNDELLTAAEWTVIRVWECEIRRDLAEAAARVAGAARNST